MIVELMEVILYVKDMQGQVSFYRDKLGLKVKEPANLADYSQEFWVELDTGACILALHAGGNQNFGADAPAIVFRVKDMEEARKTLQANGVTLGEVREPAPGILVCDGRDPEGNRFSIEVHP